MSVLQLLQLRAFQLSLPRKGRCRPRAVVICQIFYFLFHYRLLAYLNSKEISRISNSEIHV